MITRREFEKTHEVLEEIQENYPDPFDYLSAEGIDPVLFQEEMKLFTTHSTEQLRLAIGGDEPSPTEVFESLMAILASGVMFGWELRKRA